MLQELQALCFLSIEKLLIALKLNINKIETNDENTAVPSSFPNLYVYS